VRINVDDLDWDEHQRAVTDDGPITGEVVEYDEAGHLLALIHYKDGFKSGLEKSYYPDGSIEFEGEWDWGHGVGVHRRWYPTGQLKAERIYNERGLLAVHRYAEDGTLLNPPLNQS
jgi:antitoxin component YwqK of YwqJK toxin-antitoxin module